MGSGTPRRRRGNRSAGLSPESTDRGCLGGEVLRCSSLAGATVTPAFKKREERSGSGLSYPLPHAWRISAVSSGQNARCQNEENPKPIGWLQVLP